MLFCIIVSYYLCFNFWARNRMHLRTIRDYHDHDIDLKLWLIESCEDIEANIYVCISYNLWYFLKIYIYI